MHGQNVTFGHGVKGEGKKGSRGFSLLLLHLGASESARLCLS